MNILPYLLRLSGPAFQRWTWPSTTKYFSPSFSYKRSPPFPIQRQHRSARTRASLPSHSVSLPVLVYVPQYIRAYVSNKAQGESNIVTITCLARASRGGISYAVF